MYPVIGKIYIEHLFTINCIEKTKINKKRPGMAHFKKKTNYPPLFFQILLLKRAVTKFKGQVNDAVSTGSEDRKVSIRSGIGSPRDLRARLFDRINSSRSAVGDRFSASGSGGAVATSVLFSNSPPSSATHQGLIL